MSWFIESEKDVEERKKRDQECFQRMIDQEKVKAEARRRWQEKLPCPTCGHKEPLPIWLY